MSETLHAEAPLANSEAARNPDGSLKDQSATTASTEATSATTTDKSTTDNQSPASTSKPEDKSLLNKEDEAKAGPPEKYEPFKAPEGYDLNPEVITKAEGIFKELGLNQAQAQSLVDFYAENAAKAAEAPYAAYEAQRKEWQDAVKADPEIGSKLPQVKETVGRALSLLGDAKLVADFKSAMDVTGVGDHPAFIKAFYKIASLVTEGKHVSGSPAPVKGPNDRPKSIAQAMYPNLPSSAG